MEDELTQTGTMDTDSVDTEMSDDDAETIAAKKKSDEDGIIAILIG